MIKRTLYFGNPAYLSLRDNNLIIAHPEVEKVKSVPKSFKESFQTTKPIEDIGMVVLDNRQITITAALMQALVENNCTIITCAPNGLPEGLMLPLCSNTIQNERYRSQIEASIPLQKQLWKQTIECKIANQYNSLQRCKGKSENCMKVWAESVKSGDSENIEARAAAFYWKQLFDFIPNFSRDREGIPPNNLLNYGYAILRAIVARALVSTGLLPTLGIHHHNRYNAYCLADDIMEPYRPYVDCLVFDIVKKYGADVVLNRDIKAILLSIATADVTIDSLRRPLMIAVSQTTASLYKCFCGQSRTIIYPKL